MKWLCLVLTLVLCSHATDIGAQDRCVFTTGHVLKSATKSEWVVEKNDKEMKGTWEKFPVTEIATLRKFWSRRDREQFEKVKTHLAALHTDPKAVQLIFEQLHRDYVESPYAGLWAAVAAAAGANQVDTASRLLEQCQERVEVQRIVAPEFHSQTVASIYNNLAIINIKKKKGNGAAGYLIRALEVDHRSTPVVGHNMRQLVKFSEANAGIAYDKGMKSKLIKAVTEIDTHDTAQLNPGWHYALDFDVPTDSDGARRVTGIDAPGAGLELVSIGTGVVMAKGIVVTARDNITSGSLVTVCQNVGDKWTTAKADSVMMDTPSSVVRSATLVSSSIGSAMVTKIVYLPVPEGSVGAGIAALRINGLNVKPAYSAESSPTSGMKGQVLGYTRSNDILTKGIQTKECSISSTHPGQSFGASMDIDGGTRGGPVLNKSGDVMGIVFDYGNNSSGGLAFGVNDIRTWFHRNVQTSELIRRGTADDGMDRLRAATLPVLCWGRNQRTVFSQLTADKTTGGMSIVDGWCLSCDGDGFFKCPNCRGLGVVPVKSMQAIGKTRTNDTILQTRTSTVRCEKCKGTKGIKCTFCNGGRLTK